MKSNPVSENGHARPSWDGGVAADLMPHSPHLAKVGGPSWSRQGSGELGQNVGDGAPRQKYAQGLHFGKKSVYPGKSSKNLQTCSGI